MDGKLVLAKWTEAGSLVESIPGPEKSEARIAVMAALLQAPMSGAVSAATEAPVGLSDGTPKISSIRQLARFARRKGATGHDVVVLLAWFQKRSDLPITSKGCRDNWLALTGSAAFATTIIL